MTQPNEVCRGKVPSGFRGMIPADPAGAAIGPMNPQWGEWLMGFPTGWTDCTPSETPSYPRSPNGSAAASSPPITTHEERIMNPAHTAAPAADDTLARRRAALEAELAALTALEAARARRRELALAVADAPDAAEARVVCVALATACDQEEEAERACATPDADVPAFNPDHSLSDAGRAALRAQYPEHFGVPPAPEPPTPAVVWGCVLCGTKPVREGEACPKCGHVAGDAPPAATKPKRQRKPKAAPPLSEADRQAAAQGPFDATPVGTGAEKLGQNPASLFAATPDEKLTGIPVSSPLTDPWQQNPKVCARGFWDALCSDFIAGHLARMNEADTLALEDMRHRALGAKSQAEFDAVEAEVRGRFTSPDEAGQEDAPPAAAPFARQQGEQAGLFHDAPTAASEGA